MYLSNILFRTSLFEETTGSTINGNSTIYYIQEVEDEQYELIFGDGVFGKALEDGNVIEVSYIVTSGDSANGINNLTFSGRLTYTRNSLDYTVTTVEYHLLQRNQSSSGGEQN